MKVWEICLPRSYNEVHYKMIDIKKGWIVEKCFHEQDAFMKIADCVDNISILILVRSQNSNLRTL